MGAASATEVGLAFAKFASEWVELVRFRPVLGSISAISVRNSTTRMGQCSVGESWDLCPGERGRNADGMWDLSPDACRGPSWPPTSAPPAPWRCAPRTPQRLRRSRRSTWSSSEAAAAARQRLPTPAETRAEPAESGAATARRTRNSWGLVAGGPASGGCRCGRCRCLEAAWP